ncbi:hypothetical protein [Nostoc sp.]
MFVKSNLLLAGRLEVAATQTKPTFPCGTLRERGLKPSESLSFEQRDEEE